MNKNPHKLLQYLCGFLISILIINYNNNKIN